MAEYKKIPVDFETYDLVKYLAKRNWRGLGAQVRIWADREMEKIKEEEDQAEAIPAVQEKRGV